MILEHCAELELNRAINDAKLAILLARQSQERGSVSGGAVRFAIKTTVLGASARQKKGFFLLIQDAREKQGSFARKYPWVKYHQEFVEEINSIEASGQEFGLLE